MERQTQTRLAKRNNPYRTQSKPAGTPRCPNCKSVNIRGRWHAADQSAAALKRYDLRVTNSLTCPACRQLKEHYAMGVIELHGENWKSKSTQVFGTIQKTEEIARSRNDQERILWSRAFRGVTKVYVTLPELARHIGRSLQRSFKGKATYIKTGEEPYLRVVWRSDEGNEKRESSRKKLKAEHRSRQWRSRGTG
jgi:hypothetical protein